MKISFTELAIIRHGLDFVWQDYLKRKCPKKLLKDELKSDLWILTEEKDKMYDLYWIQQIRNKLNKALKNYKGKRN